jgi:hypothetical protein
MTATTAWTCRSCGTDDPALRYPSGRNPKCLDCQRLYNVRVNSRKVRVDGTSPGMGISDADFLAWCRSTPKRCAYCGVAEADVARLGLRTTIGLDLVALGVDRVDNDRGYDAGNIQFACFACNKAKGNTFTHAEMLDGIGAAVARVWTARLGDGPLVPIEPVDWPAVNLTSTSPLTPVNVNTMTKAICWRTQGIQTNLD